jgi:hypothetical protein
VLPRTFSLIVIDQGSPSARSRYGSISGSTKLRKCGLAKSGFALDSYKGPLSLCISHSESRAAPNFFGARQPSWRKLRCLGGDPKKLRFPPRIRPPGTQYRQENYASWMATAPHPANGISHARIAERLTRETWLEKAVVRQGPTSIYYTYMVYAGATPEEGPWMVQIHGNDVNWEYYPRTDDSARSSPTRTTHSGTRTARTIRTSPRGPCRPSDRGGLGNVPPSLTSLSNLVRAGHRRVDGGREAQRSARIEPSLDHRGPGDRYSNCARSGANRDFRSACSTRQGSLDVVESFAEDWKVSFYRVGNGIVCWLVRRNRGCIQASGSLPGE